MDLKQNLFEQGPSSVKLIQNDYGRINRTNTVWYSVSDTEESALIVADILHLKVVEIYSCVKKRNTFYVCHTTFLDLEEFPDSRRSVLLSKLCTEKIRMLPGIEVNEKERV